jgi:hypothetical protein
LKRRHDAGLQAQDRHEVEGVARGRLQEDRGHAKQKVAQAEADAFHGADGAIDAILEGADMQDAMSLAAHVLAEVAAGGCDEHLTDLKADFLRMVDDFIAMARQNEERDAG